MALPQGHNDSNTSRRSFLLGCAATAAGIGLYGWGPARNHLTLVRHDVYIPDLPSAFNGFTIAQLSDFHFGPFNEDKVVKEAVTLVNSLNPQMVALTGDFITANHDDNSINLKNADRCAEALACLRVPLKFASLGNHDTIDSEGVTAALEDKGISVLRNAHIPLDLRGDRIWIAGLADAMFDHPKPGIALPISTIDPVIVLGHEPDYMDTFAEFNAVHKRRCDLFLTGHTHGGQVNLPVLTRMVLPRNGKNYLQGPFQVGPTLLYVNRGLGTIHLPIRLNAPPEVTLLKLHGI